MDWQTILTSGVIAAIVTGIIELIKQGNSNKTRYIIEQREEWREKIRNIADEIQSTRSRDIQLPLTRLRTRINSYGKYIKHPSFSDLEKRTKEETSLIEDYYLNDGHIHEILQAIEENKEFDRNKKILIDYISLLLKFDWERSKMESTVNRKAIFSFAFATISICLITIMFPPIIPSHIIFLIIYALAEFAPTLAMLYFNSSILRKKSEHTIINIIGASFIVIIILACLVINITKFVIFMFPVLISSVSIIFSINAVYEQRRLINSYVQSLEKVENKHIKNDTTK